MAHTVATLRLTRNRTNPTEDLGGVTAPLGDLNQPIITWQDVENVEALKRHIQPQQQQ